MICDRCKLGKMKRVVGNGISEPPYLWLIQCPFDTEYYKHPDDECEHEAEYEALKEGDK